MNKNPIKYGIIIAIILLIFSSLYFLIKELTKDDSLGYQYLKNYEVNEYIPTYVSDEDMAKIYLNDYIHNMYYNVEEAYNLLDEEYKSIKFGSLQNYINYVNELNYSNYGLSTYYIKNIDGYKIFGITDKNGNFYAFKTRGVMQYSVYLDDSTVEIW